MVKKFLQRRGDGKNRCTPTFCFQTEIEDNECWTSKKINMRYMQARPRINSSLVHGHFRHAILLGDQLQDTTDDFKWLLS